MIEHIVLFQLNDTVTTEMEQDLVKKLLDFNGKIPGIVEITAGVNATEEIDRQQGYRIGLRVTFEDQEALRQYGPHPLHQAFVQSLNGIVKNVIVADYPIS
jgi:hypothetical protein